MSQSPAIWQVIKSVLAAAFGVQSQANHEFDFQQTNPTPYILVGIAFVVLLVFGLIGLVMLFASVVA